MLRRELWNGNRESWASLMNTDRRENVLLWSWTQHRGYRHDYEEASAADSRASWVRLRTPRDAKRWLSDISQ